MLFQAVLFTVIAYLVACYAYGLFLLWKLYAGRKFQDDAGQGEHPLTAESSGDRPVSAPQPAFDTAEAPGTSAKAA